MASVSRHQIARPIKVSRTPRGCLMALVSVHQGRQGTQPIKVPRTNREAA